jgi:uncharacterized protein (DUF2345 family)
VIRVAANGGIRVAANGGIRVAANGGIRVAANGGICVAANGGICVAANGGICVAHPFTFDNVNKTGALLQKLEGKTNRTSFLCGNHNGHHNTGLRTYRYVTEQHKKT